MKNDIIINQINKLNKNTIEVLDTLLSDFIIEMEYRNRVSKDILERIVLVYLSLFKEKNYLEYDELKLSEKNIICRIISKGIASIFVDDEYINNNNAKDKLVIMNDMVDLLYFLTDFNKSTIRRLVIRDIKIYFYRGWRWDFI